MCFTCACQTFLLRLFPRTQKNVIHSLKSHYLQDFLHPRWCRTSEASTVAPEKWMGLEYDSISFWDFLPVFRGDMTC